MNNGDAGPPADLKMISDPMPEPPSEPDAGSCCQSGCDPCVYDLYWQAYDRYEQALADWHSRNSEANR